MIHSVLTARIILNLRQLASDSRLGFSTFSVGVRGATTNSVMADVEFVHPESETTVAEDEAVYSDIPATA